MRNPACRNPPPPTFILHVGTPPARRVCQCRNGSSKRFRPHTNCLLLHFSSPSRCTRCRGFASRGGQGSALAGGGFLMPGERLFLNYRTQEGIFSQHGEWPPTFKMLVRFREVIEVALMSEKNPVDPVQPEAPFQPSWVRTAPRAPVVASPRPPAGVLPSVVPAVTQTPPASEAPVRYDLAGNPLPALSAPPVLQTASVPGVWPPTPVGGGYAPSVFRNTSGEQGHLPPEIDRLRWNWGAFFFPVLWCRKHELTTVAGIFTAALIALRVIRYITQLINPVLFFVICGVYAVTYLALQVYFGLNGHTIGWRNRRFQGGVEEYFKVQSAWMWWGFGINIFLAVVLPVMLIFGALGAIGSGSSHQPTAGSGSYGTAGSGDNNSINSSSQ